MNTLEAIAKRYSCRNYKPEQISEAALNEILKAGMAAPVGSAAYDSMHITVIQDRELLNKISDAVSEMVSKMFGRKVDKNFGAPTMIIVSAKPGMMPGMEYANAACVLENMLIAATGMGIDNIIWGGGAAVAAQSEELMKRLSIPEGFKPVLCASFGYAVNDEPAKSHTIAVNRL